MTESFHTLNGFRDFPKSPRDNLIWRRKIIARAKLDLEYRAKVKELFHRDILFAFNAFFFTLDPRKRPLHNQPFCTYPYQDEVLLQLREAIDKGFDLPIEKSRDMGASWMIILTFLWFWLSPKGGADFLLGSRIEDYVDKKGDMRTLMQKARYALYKLPKWLRPKGFSRKQHDNYMKLINPETGASITGESNNANFSTGGRYAAILYDEFAKWKDTDRSAWIAGGDATPCRIPNSTPFGAAGQHYDLVTSGKPKVVMHWSRHPEKAAGLYCVWPKPEEADEVVDWEHWTGLRSPWYDRECARRDATPVGIAQELDIDYVGAGNPVFDGRAGKRMAQLLRVVKTPEAVYRVLLEEQKLEPCRVVPDDLANHLVVYEAPRQNATYVIGCDVAEGKEHGDYSVVKVLRRETESLVATFFSRYDEKYISMILARVWEFYSWNHPEFGTIRPWWGVETNGPGLGVFDPCVEYWGMTNPFMMPIFDRATGGTSVRKGWWTTSQSRNILIVDFKNWLVEGQGWVDQRCVREMTTFVRDKSGKPQAKDGCNDDEVMCWGICLQLNKRCPQEDFFVEEKFDAVDFQEVSFQRERFERVDEPSLEERCLEQLCQMQTLGPMHQHPLADYAPY